jgi:histidinol dehydrogenase
MIRIVPSSQVGRILARRSTRLANAEKTVRPILEDVRKRGDRAVLEYARRFDALERPSVHVPPEEAKAAAFRLPSSLIAALWEVSRNIRTFAQLQLPEDKRTTPAPGLRIGQIVRPLDTVAVYIPSGRYPLPSTLLMTVLPAQVAGVPHILVATPRAVDEVFGTAHLLKVSHLYQMGGAHAIAAFAYGTKTIPKADRIVGPGNLYVAAAKKLLAGEAGIDFIAGPTEIMIMASEGNPAWLAADMLAQAEHDVEASAILLTTSKRLAEAVSAEIEIQLRTLPTAKIAGEAIRRNSAIIILRALAEGIEIVNRFAPEHLSIPDSSLLDGIRHAGSVFIGAHSPEAAGDYGAGPNHVLPTSGYARVRGGLSATDFVKVISIQELSPMGLRRLAPAIITLARAEGLEAHARSVEARFRG